MSETHDRSEHSTMGDGVAVRYNPAAERFQAAFEAIVGALRRYREDKEKAEVYFAEKAERESLQKLEQQKKIEEAKRNESELTSREERREESVQRSEGEREGSPSPTAPKLEKDKEKEKKAPSLFASFSSPTTKESPSPSDSEASVLLDPHGPTHYKLTAAKSIIKSLKLFFEACLVATDAPLAAPYAPWVANLLLCDGGGRTAGPDEGETANPKLSSSTMVRAQQSSILEDHNVALYSMCFANSSCLYAGHLDSVLDGDALFALAMAVARIHRRQRKIIHVCFSGMVNMCHVPKLSITSVDPQSLVELVAPQHSEARVVEAWAMAVTNLCLRFPPLIKQFCECGAVLTIERLLLLFGDDPKVLNRGLSLLSLLTQHTVATE